MVDENGNYFGLRKTNAQNSGSTMYNFLFNAQGDVIGLVDNMGNFQASYTYDAWGKVLSVKDKNGNEITDPNHIANINPIRYRGYYYDTETGFYYLQSRYYDPTVGRFINADDTDILLEDQDSLLQHNLFAYCFNNPVNMYDPDGEMTAAAGVLAPTFITWLYYAGGANFWNPVGWVLLGIASVSLLVYISVSLYKMHKASKARTLSSSLALIASASTTATPPPPNKGGKGTQVSSKTLYKKNGKNGFRLDVENPGNRAGQIHLQKNGVKYYYDVVGKVLRVGSSKGALAPKSIQKLLVADDVINALAKGLKILGY